MRGKVAGPGNFPGAFCGNMLQIGLFKNCVFKKQKQAPAVCWDIWGMLALVKGLRSCSPWWAPGNFWILGECCVNIYAALAHIV